MIKNRESGCCVGVWFGGGLRRWGAGLLLGLGLVPAATAGVLAVTGDAHDGSYGLNVTPTGCVAPDGADLLFDSVNVSGSYSVCNTVTTSAVQVTGDTDITAGMGVLLMPDFGVDNGVVFQVAIDNPSSQFAWVEDVSPEAEGGYNASFYVDLNNLALGAGDELDLFAGYSANGAQFRVILRSTGLVVAARVNGSDILVESAPAVAVPADGWFSIDVSLLTGAGNGSLTLSVDGDPFTGLTGLTNDDSQVDSVRLGAVDGVLGAGAYIAFDVDSFSSGRLEGPNYTPPGAGAEGFAGSAASVGGATISETGYDLGATDNLYFGVRADSFLVGYSMDGPGISGNEIFRYASKTANSITYTGQTTLHTTSQGTHATATRMIFTLTGTGSTLRNPNTVALNNPDNGDVEALWDVQSSDFSANVLIEAQVPPFDANAGNFEPANDLFNRLNTQNSTGTSFDWAFYYNLAASFADGFESNDLLAWWYAFN